SAALVQSTFLACVEAADRYRGEGSFKSFLFGIAHNLLREHYRRRRSDDPVDDDRAGPSPSPSLLVGAKDEQRLLLAGLRALPAELQVVLELFYWEDMTAAEIGGAIGIPEGTAKSRLRRGREELDKQLRRLATSDQLLASTLTRLDDWAQDLRQRIEVPEG
ncbi:MAG: sigma-70 family RNA polymerase sigma factor, partial [Myxococcales bacterium]|nr:sigma-70 family RNA polymerase sigma factor [Myxococcales bacterium]